MKERCCLLMLLASLMASGPLASAQALDEARILRASAGSELLRAFLGEQPEERAQRALDHLREAATLLGEAREAGAPEHALVAETDSIAALRYWLAHGGEERPDERGTVTDLEAERQFLAAQAFEQANPGRRFEAMARYFQAARSAAGTEPARRAEARVRSIQEELRQVSLSPMARESTGIEMPTRVPQVLQVSGHQRLHDRDQLALHSGEKISGTVVDEELTLVTRWGELTLPVGQVAGIQFLDRPHSCWHAAVVTLVDHTTLHCRLQGRELRFALTSGQTAAVAWSRVRRLIRRLQADELDQVPLRQCVVTKRETCLYGASSRRPWRSSRGWVA